MGSISDYWRASSWVSILNNVLFTVTHGMQQLEIQLQLQLDQLKQVNALTAPR
jgi:hypothetical protein